MASKGEAQLEPDTPPPMTSRPDSPPSSKPLKDALQPIVIPQAPSALSALGQAIVAPFTHHRGDSSTKIFSELAPHMMTPRMVHHATTRPRRGEPSGITSKYNFSIIGRAPLRLGLGRRVTSRDLQIIESAPDLLSADIPEPEGIAQDVSLFQGFQATIPSSERNKTRRRRMRNVQFEGGEELGHKKLGMEGRGLITNVNTDSGGRGSKRKGKKTMREPLSASKILGKEELSRQRKEILQDKENLHVRRKLIQSDVVEISHKIRSLESMRSQLEKDLLKLQEEELELDDELQGVEEREVFESSGDPKASESFRPSRRRKGPAFLPSAHDNLPHGVAFMTLDAHNTPITALDFSEPYGMLVTASQDESTRLWDLTSGEEIGFLRGHSGAVRCLQVEQNTCVTGGTDGTVKLWDLRAVEDEEEALVSLAGSPRSTIPSIPDDDQEAAVLVERPSMSSVPRGCLRTFEGHTKGVSAVYFEESCLVSGASDKTLRQWDLNTGQCVMTMDILWAISHPPPANPRQSRGNPFGMGGLPGASLLSAASSSFAAPSPPNADGGWDMHQEFVGGVQFWGYALVSGSGDGAVRMWDMRTGQAHRTLVGHTAPVTCLQFDELHIVSGSLDKTIKIWDLRTGGISETLRHDHPITSLQFDSRKIVSCTGENGIKIYNRTTMQHSTLTTNGHAKPVDKLRYMDRYLVSGARDATVKVWAL